jgi:nitroimidazol reductase NimA-like FMN-containing flavoprotein (pyridoxamine 5'-phosphate oxidase superfamily)
MVALMTATMRALARHECLERLRAGTVGRVAVTDRALPAVVPVNYTVMGNVIVFRTEPHGMLARACDDAVVAFEVDELRPDGQGGWSVLVVGVAGQVTGSAELRAVEAGLVTAVGDSRDLFISIPLTQVTGRSVTSSHAMLA